MKFLFSLILILNISFAECYIVNNLKGSTYTQSENYKLSNDKFSHPFELIFDGKNSKVSQSDLSYVQIGQNAIIGIYYDDLGHSTIETWVIHPLDKKVTYTKNLTGYGQFNGARVFVGDLIGNCK